MRAYKENTQFLEEKVSSELAPELAISGPIYDTAGPKYPIHLGNLGSSAGISHASLVQLFSPGLLRRMGN